MSPYEKTITGLKLPKDKFRVQESVSQLELCWVEQLLSGQLAAYCVRSFTPLEDRLCIVKNFWNSTARVPRYGVGEGGVEGYFVGASHIEKTTQEYLDQVQYYRQSVNDLFQGTSDPLARMRDELKKGSLNIRAATHEGCLAGDAKAVCWNNIGEFLLLPHDDLAQLSDNRQKGFEIQQIERVIAANFYAEMPDLGGQLKVWNIEPDNISRQRLGLRHSGFPYPVALLHDHVDLVISVEAGDLVLLNGNLIHAVLGGTDTTARLRLLVTCFMGILPTAELVWWT
ncbi:hypothetical protein YKD1_07430 [Yersinia pseudotuberculosis]|uniref:hypothetical protein n=1 Tax=Yersinia pseudotuberculosis complex TaxID=1649845 RepID=UPI0011AAA373|nr:hypothetical protein [Yersinia similis]